VTESEDPHGGLWAIEPDVDANELNGLVDAAQTITIIQSRRERAWIYVYPLSIGGPDRLLAVDPGGRPAVLGSE
jgi:hypothetical protein